MKHFPNPSGPGFSLKRPAFALGTLLYAATVQWLLVMVVGTALFILPGSAQALDNLLEGWRAGDLGSGVLLFLLQACQYSWPALIILLPTLGWLRWADRKGTGPRWLILLAGTILCIAIPVARLLDSLSYFVEPDGLVVFRLCWPWVAAAALVLTGANRRYLRAATPS